MSNTRWDQHETRDDRLKRPIHIHGHWTPSTLVHLVPSSTAVATSGIADAKTDGLTVKGEDTVSPTSTVFSEPFLNIPETPLGMSPAYRGELDFLRDQLPFLFDFGMTIPVVWYITGTSMEFVALNYYGLVGWTAGMADGETIGLIEGVPLVRNDAIGGGSIAGYWPEFGVVPNVLTP